MAQPQAYERQYDFSDFQTDNPSDPLPGTQLDLELDEIKQAIDETQDFIERVLNDEGDIRAQTITPAMLSPATVALMGSAEWTVASAKWATATAYTAGTVLRYDESTSIDGTYLVTTDHTSGVFATDLAANKLALLAYETPIALPLAVASGGTGATSAGAALTNLGGAASGANTDITSLGGLTTPLSVAQGGTGAATASAARTALGVVNFDIPGLTAMSAQIAADDSFPIYDLSATAQREMTMLEMFGVNLLVNGAANVWQLGTSSTARADDAYALDGWYVLAQSNPLTAERVSAPFDGTRYAARVTQAHASAQRFGFAQIVEGKDSIPHRGRNVTLQGRLACSAAATVRYAICGWTSTEDSVTSDVVADWTSATFTAGNFFLASNLSVLATGSLALSAATWTDITPLTAAVTSGVNNLVVFVWTDATAAQNVTLDFTAMALRPGSVAVPFIAEPFAIDVMRCQRLYEKTFALETAPAEGVGLAGGHDLSALGFDSSLEPVANWVFKVEKRATPAVSLFNPRAAGTDAQWDSNSASLGAARALSPTTSHVQIDNTGTAPSGVSARYYICAVADARL